MSKNLLDLLSEEDKGKALKRNRQRRVSKSLQEINPEIYLVAEFGYYFGYDGIRAIKNNEITLDEVRALIIGARKVWYSRVVDSATGSLAATGAVNSKKPAETFGKIIKPYTEGMKVKL